MTGNSKRFGWSGFTFRTSGLYTTTDNCSIGKVPVMTILSLNLLRKMFRNENVEEYSGITMKVWSGMDARDEMMHMGWIKARQSFYTIEGADLARENLELYLDYDTDSLISFDTDTGDDFVQEDETGLENYTEEYEQTTMEDKTGTSYFDGEGSISIRINEEYRSVEGMARDMFTKQKKGFAKMRAMTAPSNLDIIRRIYVKTRVNQVIKGVAEIARFLVDMKMGDVMSELGYEWAEGEKDMSSVLFLGLDVYGGLIDLPSWMVPLMSGNGTSVPFMKAMSTNSLFGELPLTYEGMRVLKRYVDFCKSALDNAEVQGVIAGM
jgi:hypothetical protein